MRNRTRDQARKWFDIRAAINGKVVVSIFEEIGFWGVSAKQFINEVKAAGDASEIELHINSPGGEVFDGLAIFNFLNQHEADVTVIIEGLAASMASVIAMAGDTVIMPENAFLMLHNPWNIVVGDSEEMRKMAETLEQFNASLARIYAAATGNAVEEIETMMD